MIFLKKALTKILLAIIFLLVSLIFINVNDESKLLYKKTILNNYFNHGIFLKKYNQLFRINNKLDDITVSSLSKANDYENYLDGVLISYNDYENIYAINSGIVVFQGNKENFGNTIIIQGIDGVDVWYGNINNTGYKLYDYVDKNTIIGTPNHNKLYIKIEKDGKVLNYQDYLDEM